MTYKLSTDLGDFNGASIEDVVNQHEQAAKQAREQERVAAMQQQRARDRSIKIAYSLLNATAPVSSYSIADGMPSLSQRGNYLSFSGTTGSGVILLLIHLSER